MPQRDYRKLRAGTWDSSEFGKAAKKLYRELYDGKDPPTEPTTAKKRAPVWVYPCGVLQATHDSLCKGTPCAFYELTVGDFRRRRGLKWGKSFDSAFGKRATKLYRTIYNSYPQFREHPFFEEYDQVNIYPCGVLEQAYAQLMAEGVQMDPPHRKPDPSLRPSKPEPERPPQSHIRQSFSHGRSKLFLEKKFAQRTADLVAGRKPDLPEDRDDDDNRNDDDPTNWYGDKDYYSDEDDE